MSVIVSFVLPHRDAALMLDSVLRTSYGNRYAGFTARKDHIEVFIADDVTDAEKEAINQLVLTHDYNLRTPDQIARQQKRDRLEALRDIIAQMTSKDELTEYLLLELENLRERVRD